LDNEEVRLAGLANSKEVTARAPGAQHATGTFRFDNIPCLEQGTKKASQNTYEFRKAFLLDCASAYRFGFFARGFFLTALFGSFASGFGLG
jgi:hypothetical protein